MQIEFARRAVLSAVIMTFAAAGAHAQQTWNPTASDQNLNTAGGTGALPANDAGCCNSAFGNNALAGNTTGGHNSGFGTQSLWHNTTGDSNTAVGYAALDNNTTGDFNTATGMDALIYNTNGFYNTAIGAAALDNNSTGWENTATGTYSLYYSTTGSDNTAFGWLALLDNTTGSDNIAIGANAGQNLTTGSYNVDIANFGVAAESATIRIGSSNQTRTFIAGISGVNLAGGGSEVYINSSGQLGTVNSSARYKQDVADMGDASANLSKLRPVTFHYKSDPSQEQQYGLIAEEVAQIYPDLVVRNANGQIESVRYYELAPMLLNELQKQQAVIQQQKEQMQQQQQAISGLAGRLSRLEARAGRIR